jgi:hypothetical protein
MACEWFSDISRKDNIGSFKKKCEGKVIFICSLPKYLQVHHD